MWRVRAHKNFTVLGRRPLGKLAVSLSSFTLCCRKPLSLMGLVWLALGLSCIQNIDYSPADFLMLTQEPLKLGGRAGQSVFGFGSRPIISKLFGIFGQPLPIHFGQAGGVGMQLSLHALI